MFSEENKPEQKREAMTKLLTFEGTKEENRERIKEFELFKEYLQSPARGDGAGDHSPDRHRHLRRAEDGL